MRKFIFLLSILVVFVSPLSGVSFAQTVSPTLTPTPIQSGPTPTPTVTSTPTPDNSSQVAALQQQINDLQNKVNDLQGQEKTLSSQISVMDNQIQLTEYKIESVKDQITTLTSDIAIATKKINNLEGQLDGLTKALLSRIVATYEVGTVQPFELLLTAGTASDLMQKSNYLQLVQDHDKKLIYEAQQAKDDYNNQKNIFEDKKKQVQALQVQLEAYSKQLDGQKADKQKLLQETQGSEANYQRLLQQTKAQLSSFSRFVQSQGGASILSNQTVCDDWGCYYNQRDSQWGGIALNNTQYTLAGEGCLITSMAMVYTHYGHKDVTPESINSNSDNFGGIPAALLKYTISANGTTAQRSTGVIDDELSAGRPVIVGISYDGGPLPDHFIVLISGSNGTYQMNDPFLPNGHNVSFNDHYSTGQIVEVDKVSI